MEDHSNRLDFTTLAWLSLVVVGMLFPAQRLVAEEIKAKFNGLTVNAQLELADGKELSDGIVLIAHALMQHNRMEMVRTLQALLKSHGYSSLAINYSLAVDDRHGSLDCMTPHRHLRDAAIEEIGFWVEWLKHEGAKNIVLAGHSTGANEVATYAGTHSDPAISRVIMITPSTSDQSSYTPGGYRSRFQKDLSGVLERANALVEAGRGDEIMDNTDFLFCAGAPVSAKTFVSYYSSGASMRLLPAQLQRLAVPTLIIAAGADNIAPDLVAIVEPYVDNERIKMVIIEDASHFLRDLFLEDAVDAMVTFLAES